MSLNVQVNCKNNWEGLFEHLYSSQLLRSIIVLGTVVDLERRATRALVMSSAASDSSVVTDKLILGYMAIGMKIHAYPFYKVPASSIRRFQIVQLSISQFHHRVSRIRASFPKRGCCAVMGQLTRPPYNMFWFRKERPPVSASTTVVLGHYLLFFPVPAFLPFSFFFPFSFKTKFWRQATVNVSFDFV